MRTSALAATTGLAPIRPHDGVFTLCWANGYVEGGADPFADVRASIASKLAAQLSTRSMFWFHVVGYQPCAPSREADVRVAFTSSDASAPIDPPPFVDASTVSVAVDQDPEDAVLGAIATRLGAGPSPLAPLGPFESLALSHATEALFYQLYTVPNEPAVAAFPGALFAGVPAPVGFGVFMSDALAALLPSSVGSLVVPPGMRADLCTASDAGPCDDLFAPAPDLGGLALATASIDPVVERLCADPTFASAPAPVEIGTFDASALAAPCLGPASLLVPPGRSVTLCRGDGDCRTVLDGVVPIEGTGSVQVQPTALARRDLFFRGPAAALPVGQYSDATTWSALGTASFSSVTVPPGLDLTVCSAATPGAIDWANATGPCAHLDGSYGGSPAIEALLGAPPVTARVDVSTGAWAPILVTGGCEATTYVSSPVGVSACGGVVEGVHGSWAVAPAFDGAPSVGVCAYTWSSPTAVVADLRALSATVGGAPLLAQCSTPSAPVAVVTGVVFETSSSKPSQPGCDVCIAPVRDEALGAVAGGTLYMSLDTTSASDPLVGVNYNDSLLVVQPNGNQDFVIPNAFPGAPDGVVTASDVEVNGATVTIADE